MRIASLPDFLLQRIDRASGGPVNRQIYQVLREAILSHQLPAGLQLPSTRELAHELAMSRNTVTHAYEQLIAEGNTPENRARFVALFSQSQGLASVGDPGLDETLEAIRSDGSGRVSSRHAVGTASVDKLPGWPGVALHRRDGALGGGPTVEDQRRQAAPRPL